MEKPVENISGKTTNEFGMVCDKCH